MAFESVTTTGLRPATFQNLQLNAGLFLTEFKWDAATDATTLKEKIAEAIKAGKGVLGATRGGGSFQCTPEIRNIEADGKRYEFKGSTVNDSWTIRLTTTLIETTPENFAHALMCADIEDVTEDGKVRKVVVRTAISDKDYIPTLCWIGDTSRGFALIELDNALNTTGANFTFTDKNEGTLPVEFVAHQADLTNQDHAPFRIVFFDDDGTEGRAALVKANALKMQKPVVAVSAAQLTDEAKQAEALTMEPEAVKATAADSLSLNEAGTGTKTKK